MKKVFIALSCLLWLSVTTAVADPIEVQAISSVVGGADMAGMRVTVGGVMAGGGPWEGSATWSKTGTLGAGAYGADWSLICPWDDTFWFEPKPFPIWTLSSINELSWFKIEALPGSTVFDIYWDLETDLTNNTSTLGSERGYWGPNYYGTPPVYGHSISGADSFGNWAFSDPVALYGALAVGDIYGTFKVDFSTPLTKFEFEVDTDAVVPEPATMLLMGLGLLGIAAHGARRKKANRA